MAKNRRFSGYAGLCVLVALVAPPSSFAQTSFYTGAGALSSQLEPRVNDSGFNLTRTESSGARVFAGADLNRRLTLEGYYTQLGSAGLSNNVVDGEVEYRAGGLSGLLYLFSSRDLASRRGLQLYGKLGVGFLSNESTSGIEFNRLNNQHLASGVGVEYGFDNGFGMRAEFVNYDADAREMSVSLIKRFGNGAADSNMVDAGKAPSGTELVDAESASTDAILEPGEAANPIAAAEENDSDGDGIGDNLDRCADTPVGSVVGEVGCVSSVAMQDVKFATGSSVLSGQAAKALDTVISELSENPELRILVQSHTDNRGLATDNMELSRQRALAVVRYLSDSGGIELERLEAIGFGESRPLQSNRTAEGRRANRRVEIEVLP